MRPVVPLAALSLLAAPPRRAGVPWACSPLTVERYGPASLHVSLDGTRSIQKFSSLPEQPSGSVRIVLVSDTHNQLSEIAIPPGDIFVHTGDITFCSSGGVNTLKDFNAQLEALPHEHKIVIAGNHDRRIEQLGKNQVRVAPRAARAAHAARAGRWLPCQGTNDIGCSDTSLLVPRSAGAGCAERGALPGELGGISVRPQILGLPILRRPSRQAILKLGATTRSKHRPAPTPRT